MAFHTDTFIGYPQPYPMEMAWDDPAPLFRRHFSVDSGLTGATLSICALGLGEAYLNGRPVTADRYIAPVSDYGKTLWYTEYEVAHLLQEGDNLAAVALGNGLYNESLHTSWDFDQAPWRDAPKLLFSLELRYGDHTAYVNSDTGWLCMREQSPFRFHQLRYGEFYDARQQTDWMQPGADESGWIPAQEAARPTGTLRRCPCPPIREDRTYSCTALFRNEQGNWVFDFGQNMSGYVEFTTGQPTGTRLRMIYAEELNEDGTRRDNSLERHYKDTNEAGDRTQISYLTCSGNTDRWKPTFAYYGFRYVIVEGLQNPPQKEDMTAYFVHQQLPVWGEFSCSDGMLNRLYDLARFSTLSNLFYVPTDCPTREKLGWCNDAQASVEQMIQNLDMRGFYEKWMQDILDAQLPDGDLPGIVPTGGWGYAWGSGPISTGILFEIPARLYQYYGDTRWLVDAYPAMRLHLQFLEGKINPDTGLCAHGLSDWAGPFDPGDPEPVPLDFTCTLLLIKFYRIAQTAAGFAGDAAGIPALRQAEKQAEAAFRRAYVGADGACTVEQQTAVSMMTVLGLYDNISTARRQLLRTFEKRNYHVYLGMLGMQYLLPACDLCGLQEEGYRLLTAHGYPSYRDWFENGATTLYETFYAGNSKNHHMYSCVIAWFHNTILGIRQTEQLALRRTVTLQPYFLQELRFAHGSFETVAGRIAVDWRRRGDTEVQLTVELPAGVRACLHLTGYTVNGQTDVSLSEGKQDLIATISSQGGTADE